MDELINKIHRCIIDLDDTADDLQYGYNIDSTELNKITDMLVDFNTKLRGGLE